MKTAALFSILLFSALRGVCGTIVLQPSSAIRALALAAVDPGVRPYVTEGLPFVLHAPSPILDQSDRAIRRWYHIDWASAFREPGKGPGLTVLRVKPSARVVDQESYYTPVFSIVIDVRTDAGVVLQGTGQASGPEFKGGWSFTKDPAAIHSSNVAFYAALLDALGRIAQQMPAVPANHP